jgi:hypothetical protein
MAVMEAAGINEQGQVIPGTCVYDGPIAGIGLLVIIEINLRRLGKWRECTTSTIRARPLHP